MGSSEGGRTPAAVSMADAARRWRVPEFVALGVTVVVLMLIESSLSEYEQFVPANNEAGVNGYPVRLGSEWCTASDLSSCRALATSFPISSSSCCKEMEAGQAPGETVPTFLLWLIYFGVPFAFIALRQGLVTCGRHQGVGTLPGILLGLGFCLGLSVLTTDGIKLLVGRPRPNYFALRALADHVGSSMSSLKGKSIRSFPSGHSSMSMAGTAYVTLVCWGDLAHFSAARKGWRRSLLAYLSILPAFISVWVGVTRVRDYWHFQDDVTAGWAIGAICAAIAVRWVVFPEDFWRGGKEGNHGSGRDVRSLRDGGALALMMDSTRCDSPGDSISDEGGDLEGGAVVSDDRSQRIF